MSVSNMVKKGNEIKHAFALNARGMSTLWREAKRYTIICYVEALFSICMPYWNIWFSARLLDAVISGEELVVLLSYTAALLGGNFFLNMLQIYMSSVKQKDEFAFSQVEQMIWGKKIMSMDYQLLEDEKIHMLHQRVVRETFNDGKNLRVIRNSMPQLFAGFVSVILAIVMVKDFMIALADQNIWFVMIMILFLVSVLIDARSGGAIEEIFQKCNEKISQNCVQRDGYSTYLNTYERGKEIRIFQLGKLLIRRLMKAHYFNDKALDERNRSLVIQDIIKEAANCISTVMLNCVTVAAAIAGKISVGSMTQCMQSVRYCITSIKVIWSTLITLWYNVDYLERYFEFLDIPSGMKKGCIPVEKRLDGEYKIVFDHVSFRYPGSDRYALKDLCLEFKVGEKMAVVGMNGSGKSTFIKLLCRLYDPTEGTIYMNGIDIKRYQYEEYLSLFSVVFQDFKLFSFGLGENVAVSEKYDEKEVEKMLEKAGLSEFLKEQKHRLKTTLYRDFEKDGVEISGGEAQKIALARAICKGAPLVLLDEPTAALDPVAEYEIYKRFNDLVADRTTVYISHRMSSCRFCGDIAVFDEGRLVQRGSHEELIAQIDGKYYELWTAQAQYYLK